MGMTVYTFLDKETFRSFTIFDILKRRRYWKSPVTFAAILSVCAVVCFLLRSIDGAVLLGVVLLVVGLGMPVVYFITFFHSLRRQVKLQHLEEPRLVYTVDLDDTSEGIRIKNDKEQVSYRWEMAYHAYRTWGCVYLYITQDRAFILKLDDQKDGGDALWALAVKMMGDGKCTDLRTR